MEPAYLHPKIRIAQSTKKPNACGDVVHMLRKREGTLILVCDGIGSGIKANLAAKMLISRFVELLEGGFSFRACFVRIVDTLNRYRRETLGYVAFTAIWIMPDGVTSILTHDAPTPIRLAGKTMAYPLKMEYETIGQAIVGEISLVLHEQEGILAMSDGITQSLLGTSGHQEWQSDEIAEFIRDLSSNDIEDIVKAVHLQAKKYWGQTNGDDCTAVAVQLRPVKRLTIFTGPPLDKSADAKVVNMLMRQSGKKAVCGGSTANIVARVLGKKVDIDDTDENPIVPPSYNIDGIDLTTEGIVTLNQVCNLISCPQCPAEEDNAVERLYQYLIDADRVDFIVGQAINPAASSRTLQQLGVHQRNLIIESINDKLRKLDKLVTLQRI